MTRGPKVSEQIARRIVHDITVGGLEPGDMLPSEVVMLENYQVGRASLREALRILELNGLIELKPGPKGGPVIVALDPRHFARMATLHFQWSGATFEELLETALLLEPLVVRSITERGDEAELSALRQSIEDAQNVSADDTAAGLSVGSAFHDVVLRLSGNRVLELIASAIRESYRDRFVALGWQHIHDEHRSIVEAMLAGDADEAERCMRVHMQSIADAVRKKYPSQLAEVVGWS